MTAFYTIIVSAYNPLPLLLLNPWTQFFFQFFSKWPTLGKNPLDKWSARRRDLYLRHTIITKERHPFPRRDSNPQSQQASGRRATSEAARPLESALLVFNRHKIQFETQFCSANVRQLEMSLRQLCTEVRIRRPKDGLKVRIYNARKCGLYKSRSSESRGPHVLN